MINFPVELKKKNRLAINDNVVYVHHSLLLEQLDTTPALTLFKKQNWLRRTLIRLFTKNIVEEIQQLRLQNFFNEIRIYINTHFAQPIPTDTPLLIYVYENVDPLTLTYEGTAFTTHFKLKKAAP